MLRRAAYDELVATVYDAGLQPDLWPRCFADIRAVVGAETSLASIQHRGLGAVRMLACNLSPTFTQLYNEVWWPHDPWMQGAARNLGRVVDAAQCLSDEAFINTKIYNELVKPHGDLRHMLGVVLQTDDHIFVTGVHRPSIASNFADADRRRYRFVLGHIHRSLQVMLRLERARGGLGLTQATLDTLSYALVIADRACRPMVVNRAAERLLARGDGLVGGSRTVPIATRNPAETEALHALVRSATADPRGPGGALRVSRGDGAAPYAVLVAPLVGQRADTFPMPGPAAMILVHDTASGPVPRARILRDLYGLTPAEGELAEHLATGARLEDVGERRGIAISTLRTQLRGLLHKTGTDRQASLVRLLASLAVVGTPARGHGM